MTDNLNILNTDGYAAQIQIFAVNGDDLFTREDIGVIDSLGLDGWALRLPEASWRDALLPLDRLPPAVRSYLVNRAIAHLKIPVRYAMPIRYLGRVLIYVILPAPERVVDGAVTIRVIRPPAPQPTPQLTPQSASGSRQPAPPRVKRDPPVPWPVLGLLDRSGIERHAQMVRDFLGGGNAATVERALPAILENFAAVGQATRSEVFYYANMLDALKTGAWMQNPDYWNLLVIEEVLARSETPFNPVLAQQLVQAHLIEGKPLQWEGYDPLTIQMQI
ncbi:MAG: hypothetical protein KJ077_10360 [Anaerolineae bacterium]|nr:hypothetical protein [Anaerolineae bacterium]